MWYIYYICMYICICIYMCVYIYYIYIYKHIFIYNCVCTQGISHHRVSECTSSSVQEEDSKAEQGRGDEPYTKKSLQLCKDMDETGPVRESVGLQGLI